MATPGPGRAGDDVQLLGRDGRADQYDRADAGHRVVDARGHVQVAGGDLRAGLGERLRRRLRRVLHQHPHRHVLLSQQPGRLGTDLSRGCHENHDGASPDQEMSYVTQYRDWKLGCQTQKSGTMDTMRSEVQDRPRLTAQGAADPGHGSLRRPPG